MIFNRKRIYLCMLPAMCTSVVHVADDMHKNDDTLCVWMFIRLWWTCFWMLDTGGMLQDAGFARWIIIRVLVSLEEQPVFE